MSHIVTPPCHDCKYTDCCVVCPVECFYQDEVMLYIDPADCIDCEACVPECPVEAIFAEANRVVGQHVDDPLFHQRGQHFVGNDLYQLFYKFRIGFH